MFYVCLFELTSGPAHHVCSLSNGLGQQSKGSNQKRKRSFFQLQAIHEREKKSVAALQLQGPASTSALQTPFSSLRAPAPLSSSTLQLQTLRLCSRFQPSYAAVPSPRHAVLLLHSNIQLSVGCSNMAMGSSTTYSPSQSLERKQLQQQKTRLFQNLDWTRSDGREFHQCRPAFLRTGAANAAAGSAYAEFGTTKVIVSVFGPRESKKAMMYSDIGRLNCNVSYTTFSCPTRGQGADNKEYSSMLHKALEGAIMLETFPKTTVDVFALVLESGGSDLPVIITCASLALADAGIMMFDLVSAVSVSCFGKHLVIDPMGVEEVCEDGSLMIACMPSRQEVTQLTLTGEWSTSKINEAMELCLDACSKLAGIMRSCLKEPISNER